MQFVRHTESQAPAPPNLAELSAEISAAKEAPAYSSSSSLPTTALTPAAVTSTAVSTTLAPTFTVVATTVTAASATDHRTSRAEQGQQGNEHDPWVHAMW